MVFTNEDKVLINVLAMGLLEIGLSSEQLFSKKVRNLINVVRS